MDRFAIIQLSKDIPYERGSLIPLLQRIQQSEGYISAESVREVARLLKISENHIYGVASFYSQFRFQKPGRNKLKVCLGTACHVQGGELLAKEVEKQLGIQSGDTTPDGNIEYEEVACLGCCAQAAVVEINGLIYARMTSEKLAKKIHELSLRATPAMVADEGIDEFGQDYS
ncbi:MAG: NAD(P)H-dependent oxidoreductase subunit E [Anaerolineales bacterium]